MPKTTARFCCARCGKKQPASVMIYSRPTSAHYCRDFKSCDRRYARRGK